MKRQNQHDRPKLKKSRRILEQIKRDLLELWRKMELLDELYKAKDET